MVVIVQKEHKVLRKKAKEVALSKITSPEIKKIISDLKKALASQLDGVAIAAPQINVSLRVFVVSGKIFMALSRSKKSEDKPLKNMPDRVYINPSFVKQSKDKAWMEEGCLSVRYLYGRAERSKKVRMKAYDEKGKAIEVGASGLLAQIFQHESDHLDGVLFIDKAKDVVELTPDEYYGHK